KEHKKIDGIVINNKHDLAYVKSFECDLYIVEAVEFLNEYRIFYEKGLIHGIKESTDFILENGTSMEIPDEFIKKCTDALDTLDGNVFVLDIGYIKERGWAVVELNPAYSLSSYNLDISTYVNFCSIFWNEI